MSTVMSSIAVGERFRQDDGRDSAQIVTIARIERDPFGLDRVIFSAPEGREITTYAIQVETALAEGSLTHDSGLTPLASATLERLAS